MTTDNRKAEPGNPPAMKPNKEQQHRMDMDRDPLDRHACRARFYAPPPALDAEGCGLRILQRLALAGPAEHVPMSELIAAAGWRPHQGHPALIHRLHLLIQAGYVAMRPAHGGALPEITEAGRAILAQQPEVRP
jgi:hypothetical protein